jgi:hypothetical protein
MPRLFPSASCLSHLSTVTQSRHVTQSMLLAVPLNRFTVWAYVISKINAASSPCRSYFFGGGGVKRKTSSSPTCNLQNSISRADQLYMDSDSCLHVILNTFIQRRYDVTVLLTQYAFKFNCIPQLTVTNYQPTNPNTLPCIRNPKALTSTLATTNRLRLKTPRFGHWTCLPFSFPPEEGDRSIHRNVVGFSSPRRWTTFKIPAMSATIHQGCTNHGLPGCTGDYFCSVAPNICASS